GRDTATPDRLRARAAAVLRVDDGGRDRLVYFVLPPCRVSQSVRRLGPPTRPGPEEAVAGPVEGGRRPRRPGPGPGARSRGGGPWAPDPGVWTLEEPTPGLHLPPRRDFLTSMVELAASGRTIFISSHGISEVERVASHVGLLSQGKLLFTGPIEEIKRRFTRIQLRTLGLPPDFVGVGRVLHRQSLGRQLDVLVQDPAPDAIGRLRALPDVTEVEEAAPGLEDIYAAVMRNVGPDGQAVTL